MPRHTLRLGALASVFALCIIGQVASEPQDPPSRHGTATGVQEIWAYLMRGEEGGLTGTEPITDLCISPST